MQHERSTAEVEGGEAGEGAPRETRRSRSGLPTGPVVVLKLLGIEVDLSSD